VVDATKILAAKIQSLYVKE